MRGPYKLQRFVRPRNTAPLLVQKYLLRFPPNQYETHIDSLRLLPSGKFELIMKRLEVPDL